MAKEYKLSQERFNALESELLYLKTTREKEVAELIKEARSFGDLSENSEYDEAKTQQAQLYSRIAEVENIIAHAVIIEENDERENVVSLGCKVTVEDLEFNEEETYQIVGSQEADPGAFRISDDAPFGKAVVGKTVGEEFVVEAPAGNIHYRVKAISR